jgi:acetolactate synthase-1/3 small subunit
VRVVDVNPESLTIEATGAGGKIDALLGLLDHYGIIELVRSGAVADDPRPESALSEKVLGSEITGR